MKNKFIFIKSKKQVLFTRLVHHSWDTFPFTSVAIMRLQGVQMAACVQILLLPASRLLEGQRSLRTRMLKTLNLQHTFCTTAMYISASFLTPLLVCAITKTTASSCINDIFLLRSCQGHIYTYLTWRTPSSRANYIFLSSLKVKRLSQGPNNGNLVVAFELTTFWSIFILTF